MGETKTKPNQHSAQTRFTVVSPRNDKKHTEMRKTLLKLWLSMGKGKHGKLGNERTNEPLPQSLYLVGFLPPTTLPGSNEWLVYGAFVWCFVKRLQLPTIKCNNDVTSIPIDMMLLRPLLLCSKL